MGYNKKALWWAGEPLEDNVSMERKHCLLDEEKFCDECGECTRCDLDPQKICDNCMKCIQTGADYTAVEIDEIIDDDTQEQP